MVSSSKTRPTRSPRSAILGADEFVDVSRVGWESAVGPVDVVYDIIGGDVFARSAALVKPGRALVSVMGPAPTSRRDIRAVSFVRDADGGQLREITRSWRSPRSPSAKRSC